MSYAYDFLIDKLQQINVLLLLLWIARFNEILMIQLHKFSFYRCTNNFTLIYEDSIIKDLRSMLLCDVLVIKST